MWGIVTHPSSYFSRFIAPIYHVAHNHVDNSHTKYVDNFTRQFFKYTCNFKGSLPCGRVFIDTAASAIPELDNDAARVKVDYPRKHSCDDAFCRPVSLFSGRLEVDCH